MHAVLTAADLGDLEPLTPMLNRPEFVPVEFPMLAAERVRHAGEPVAMVVADSPHAAEDATELIVVDYEPDDAVGSIEAALEDDAPRVHDQLDSNVLLDVPFAEDPEMDDVLAQSGARRRGGVRLRPPDRGAARGPRLPRRVGARRPARRPAHLDAGPAPRPHHRGRDPRPRRAPRAGRRARRRRRLRPEVRGRARGGARVRRRPRRRRAGEVGRGSRREPAGRLPGPRAALHRPRRLRRRGPHAGRRRRHRGRRRRLLDAPVHLRRRAADGGDRDARPLPRRALPLPHPRGRHQQGADGALPRRRAPADGAGDGAAAAEGGAASSSSRSTRSACATWPASSRTSARPACRSTRAPTASRSSCARSTLDLPAFRERQRAAREEGRLLGLGLSVFAERTGYGTEAFAQRKMAITPGYDTALVRMDPSGSVLLSVGTSGHGQGHQTTLSQVAADRLGLTPDRVEVRQGDTDATPVRLGHVREPLDGGRRRRHAARLRPARRAPQDARRAHARGRPRGPRAARRRGRRARRARQERHVRGDRAARLPRDPRPARGRRARPRVHRELRPARHVLQRLPRRDRRARPRDDGRADRALRRRRGLRRDGQPGDRRGPGPRRRRPGRSRRRSTRSSPTARTASSRTRR